MEEREQKSGGAGCFITGVIGLFVPVLYILSVGPADWLGRNYSATQDFLMVVYFPVSIAANFLPPFGRALEWYLSFWR